MTHTPGTSEAMISDDDADEFVRRLEEFNKKWPQKLYESCTPLERILGRQINEADAEIRRLRTENAAAVDLAVATIFAVNPDASFDDSAVGGGELRAWQQQIARAVAEAFADPGAYERVKAMRQDARRWRFIRLEDDYTEDQWQRRCASFDTEIAALSPEQIAELDI